MTRLLRMLALSAIALAALTRMASAQEVILQNYYESRATQSCVAGSSCRADFPKNSSGRIVLITDVNCMLTSDKPIYQTFLALASSSGGASVGRYIYLEPKFNAGSSYVVVNKVNFIVGASSKFPFVGFYANAAATSPFMDCSISGTYTQ